MPRKAKVDRDTWFEYMSGNFCGLCANTGLISISGLKTAAGHECLPIVNKPCICPNGRAIKFYNTKHNE
jgi:hypothetical protein